MRWIVVGALVLVGCTEVAKMCTEVGCQGLLELRLPAEAVGEGPHTVEVDLGDWVVSCAVDAASPGDTGTLDDCGVQVDAGAVVLSVRTGMGVAPEVVPVTVLAGADVVASGTAEPVWDAPYYPNGEGCDPGCQDGVADVVLD